MQNSKEKENRKIQKQSRNNVREDFDWISNIIFLYLNIDLFNDI